MLTCNNRYTYTRHTYTFLYEVYYRLTRFLDPSKEKPRQRRQRVFGDYYTDVIFNKNYFISFFYSLHTYAQFNYCDGERSYYVH